MHRVELLVAYNRTKDTGQKSCDLQASAND
jgi:hypothetical protein